MARAPRMGGVWGFFMVPGIIVAQRLLPSAAPQPPAWVFRSLGLPNVYLAAALGLAMMARRYDLR